MKNKKTIIILLIIILLFLLLATTYAWFIFNSTVNLSIEAKIKNWSIEFKENEQILEEEIEFQIDDLYPGMEEQTKEISIANNGDLAADLGYKIVSIEVLGEKISLEENFTEQQIIEYIEALPFSINIEFNKESLEPNEEDGNYKISVNWPYEEETNDEQLKNEKDKLDTEFGIKAYEFNSLPENEGKPNFKITIHLFARQTSN